MSQHNLFVDQYCRSQAYTLKAYARAGAIKQHQPIFIKAHIPAEPHIM
jgi:hypothetical protein